MASASSGTDPYPQTFNERPSQTIISRVDVIEGSEGVTQCELDTLRHISDKLPYTAWLVVFVEFAERWTFYGTTNIFNNYVRVKLPPGSTTGAVVDTVDRATNGIAGGLGKGQQVALAVRTFNTFYVYVTPIVGAILADAKWGRYRTLVVASLICLAGHAILVGSATPQSLQHPDTALALLIFSIVIMGTGAGFIKANVAPMLGEQCQGKLRKVTLKSGEEVIMSPALTLQSIYLWFYAAINVGACAAISSSFVARIYGFWVAWMIPLCIFYPIPCVLLIWKKFYMQTAPRGSVILETLRVVRISMTSLWSTSPCDIIRAIKAPTFWDSAKPSSYPAGQVPRYITWDDAFVAEVSRTCNACAVFLFFPIYWLCYSQIDGNLGTMAAGMTLNGLPNDLIQNLNPITIIILVPIFDCFIYPSLRRRAINFSPIKRIYAGFIAVGLAMLWAGILQHYNYLTSPCHDNLPSECVSPDRTPMPSPISAWLIAGPYILVAISEIFAAVTAIEYAYTKAPVRMKSVVMAFSYFQTVLASLLNFLLVPVSTEDKFAWLFGSFGITAIVVGTIFFFLFRGLDAKEDSLNAIGRGDRPGFVDETPDMMKPDYDKHYM